MSRSPELARGLQLEAAAFEAESGRKIDAHILQVEPGVEQPGFAQSLVGAMSIGRHAVMPTRMYLAAIADLVAESWRFAGLFPQAQLVLSLAGSTFGPSWDQVWNRYERAGQNEARTWPGSIPALPGQSFRLRPTFALQARQAAVELIALVTVDLLAIQVGSLVLLQASLVAQDPIPEGNQKQVVSVVLAYLAGEALGHWVDTWFDPGQSEILLQTFDDSAPGDPVSTAAFRRGYVEHTLDEASQARASASLAAMHASSDPDRLRRAQRIAGLTLHWPNIDQYPTSRCAAGEAFLASSEARRATSSLELSA